MENLDEVKSILWHEIGHLLIDLLIVNSHSDIIVSKVVIRNYDCENFDWCGLVDSSPKEKLEYSEVVKSDSLIAFKFFSLISGCIFQSEFDATTLKFKNCFAFKKNAIGKGDYSKFYEISYKLRDTYKVLEDDKKKFYQKLDEIVLEKYPREILKLEKFTTEMKKFIAYLGKIIITDFNSNSNQDRYSYVIAGEFLNSISEQLLKIMKTNGFITLIEGLHQELVLTIQKHIIKK
jgi:hypothetical protein